MKKIIALCSGTALLALALTLPAFADEKTVTISGEAKCAKCSLKQADKCQTVIETTENGKTVTYWIAKNDVAKEFHENVCQEAKKATATGTVKEADGKKELTATKIELAKQ